MSSGSDRDPERALLSRGKRRRFLRTLVNVGFGAGVATHLSRRGLLAAEETIVYGLTWREEAEPELLTRQVPRGWYESLQQAFAAQQSIIDAGFPAVVGAFVVPGDFDDPAPRLDVDVTSDADGLSGLEELLSDVEYTIDHVSPNEPEFGIKQSNDVDANRIELDGDRVPGGALCMASEHMGTLAPALTADGRRVFATSNHVFGAQGSLETEHRGEPLYLLHDDGRTVIGTVLRGLPEEDVVLVAPVHPYEPAGRIAGVSPSRVAGHFTKVGLADLYARGERLEKVGAFGGHATGQIDGIDGVTCYYGGICRRGQLKWGSRETMTDGDSGSVSYHPDPERPDQLLVASVNNARTWWPGADFTWGPAAYHLFEQHGYYF